jgi:hypothetical protein
MGMKEIHYTKADFDNLVKKTDTCWLWLGKRQPNGYGRCSRSSFLTNLAHRAAYQMANGEIPKGLHVLHRCDVKHCVNPEHLFLGTHADNMKDMVNKGRSPIGTKNNKAKLNSSSVIEMRDCYITGNFSLKGLAKIYNISTATVRACLLGKSWSIIPNRPAYIGKNFTGRVRSCSNER